MAKENDLYCGVKIIWSWDKRLWSWFTSHGIQSAYCDGKWKSDTQGNIKMLEAPRRVFNRVYHVGPLKIFVGVLKQNLAGASAEQEKGES